MRKVTIIAVVLAFVLPLSHLHVYNEGVRDGYDEVAGAIGVTATKAFVIGNAKVTSTGIYHKRKPQIVRDFLACSSSCHGGF